MAGAVEEGGAAALGRPMEGEGVALGKPKEGEGKLGSDTASGKVGKLLMCSLFTGQRERKMGKDKHSENVSEGEARYIITGLI